MFGGIEPRLGSAEEDSAGTVKRRIGRRIASDVPSTGEVLTGVLGLGLGLRLGRGVESRFDEFERPRAPMPYCNSTWMASVKLEVTPLGPASRCQSWKYQVSPGNPPVKPVGWGIDVRSTVVVIWPVVPLDCTWST